MVDPRLLPPWLSAIEWELIGALGEIDLKRRELLDQFLLSCLQLIEVERLIDTAAAQMFTVEGPGLPGLAPTPASLSRNAAAELAQLTRLEAYRRRFRGRRDRCLAQPFPKGM